MLHRKIKDKQKLDVAYSADDRRGSRVTAEPGPLPQSPDFEKLAGEPDVDVEQVDEESPAVSKKKAGRPTGQTDERAHIERLLKLEVPDLVVLKAVSGVCFVLGRYTKNPFSKEQVTSMALGATRELYFWYPQADGKISQWALHAQALEDIGKPLSERALEAKEKRDQQESEKEIENEPEQETQTQEGKEGRSESDADS